MKNSQSLFRRSINGGQFFEVLFRVLFNVYPSKEKRSPLQAASIDAGANFNSPVKGGHCDSVV